MQVAVFGINGKMGRAITKNLLKEEGIQVIAGFDKVGVGKDIGSLLNVGETGSFVYDSYEEIKKCRPDLIIDFTSAAIVTKTINWAIENNINIVVGTTGISKEDLKNIEKKVLKASSKVFIVPNFSIGAVIMIKVSRLVSKYFDNCEIIELHHDQKKDAPSGTSISTAENIGTAKNYNGERLKEFEEEKLEGSRGAFADGIHIHSIRLPGLLAHQNVIFGTKAQTLSIRHDSIDRDSFYPGVLMAIKNIGKLNNFTYGLDKLIEI
ncbi:MAG: 4-hydroxy-tetrahydrodipicolinate reductase [Candidatus Humimicrobiaceae bacterium]